MNQPSNKLEADEPEPSTVDAYTEVTCTTLNSIDETIDQLEKRLENVLAQADPCQVTPTSEQKLTPLLTKAGSILIQAQAVNNRLQTITGRLRN